MKALSDSVQVWRVLKGLTSGVARVVVQSVEGENGSEAWRRLYHQFEPKLVIKQGQVLSVFTARISSMEKWMDGGSGGTTCLIFWTPEILECRGCSKKSLSIKSNQYKRS